MRYILLLLIAATLTMALYWAAFAQDKPKPLGGDLIPVRSVADPYPVFNGIAVDPVNNLVVMTDVNRKSILAYARTAAATNPGDLTPSLRQVVGPETNIGFVTGILLDPERRELSAVNNDIEDTMVTMPYDAAGNQPPARLLAVPHQAWGAALGKTQNEVCLTVENQNAVANHGNFRGVFKNTGGGCVPTDIADSEVGELKPPSINIYSGDAEGNRKPLRMIQGVRTRLDFPMNLTVDEAHDEIAVANNGDSSILIFRRTANGDAAPVRVIGGDRTGVNHPMGIALDARNDEIWVSNFGDHTAVAFARTANGNVAPKRVIRTAPAGTPTTGFGNPQTVAYDSKREEILVPN